MPAQSGPRLDQLAFINQAGTGGADGFELALGDFQQLGKVDLGGVFTEEMAIEHQFLGVALFLVHALQLAVDGAVAEDDMHV